MENQNPFAAIAEIDLFDIFENDEIKKIEPIENDIDYLYNDLELKRGGLIDPRLGTYSFDYFDSSGQFIYHCVMCGMSSKYHICRHHCFSSKCFECSGCNNSETELFTIRNLKKFLIDSNIKIDL
jgi:hypothetical protein